MQRFHASVLLVLAVVAVGLLPAAASAESIINVHFEGLKFHYSDPGIGVNGAILDRDASNTNNTTRVGGNVSAYATPSTAVSVFKDQVLQGMVSNSYADMYVDGIPDIAASPSGTYSAGASGFGFDLISSADGISGSNILQLDFTSFQVSYLNFGVVSIVAGGGENSIVSQNLPFGLQIDSSKPITFSLTSAALSNVVVSGGRVVSFDAFGTGDINATLVPEPASLVGLACMAICGLAYAVRRRRDA